MPDRSRERYQRRRPRRADAGVHVRGCPPCSRQSLERQRPGDSPVDAAFLSRHASRKTFTGRRPADRPGGNVETNTMAVAILLGGFHDAGRVEIVALRNFATEHAERFSLGALWLMFSPADTLAAKADLHFARTLNIVRRLSFRPRKWVDR